MLVCLYDRHVPVLQLTPDELLSTTRAVRKRLDVSRPVEREVLEECLRLAQQAPTGSNQQHWSFLVVTDAATRAALADLYRKEPRPTDRTPAHPAIASSKTPSYVPSTSGSAGRLTTWSTTSRRCPCT